MTSPYQDPSVKKLLDAAMGLHAGAHVDLPPRVTQDKPMAEITREELDAKLETIEVRMDARVASIEGKIDSFMSRLDDRFLRTDERMSRIEQDISEVRTDSKNLKFWLAGTAVAVVLGIAGVNIAMLQTMLASFESGKSISTAQAEIKRQSEETGALLKQLQQTYPPPPATTAPK
jgi:hypothetical protein